MIFLPPIYVRIYLNCGVYSLVKPTPPSVPAVETSPGSSAWQLGLKLCQERLNVRQVRGKLNVEFSRLFTCTTAISRVCLTGDSRLCRVVTLLPLLPFLLLHVVLHQRSTPGDKTVIPRGRVPLLLED